MKDGWMHQRLLLRHKNDMTWMAALVLRISMRGGEQLCVCFILLGSLIHVWGVEQLCFLFYILGPPQSF